MTHSALNTVNKSGDRRDESIARYFRKIQEAAHDGLGGADGYARDRLALIQSIATSALHIHFEE